MAASGLLEFLEAAVHQLLAARAVYPPELFRGEQLYGVPLMRPRHPELNQYVGSALSGLWPHIEQGAVRRLALVILDAARQAPLERFVFEFDLERRAAGGAGGAVFAGAAASAGVPAGGAAPYEATLRAALLKLTYCGALLRPLPSDCVLSFELVAYSAAAVDPSNVWVEEGARSAAAFGAASAAAAAAAAGASSAALTPSNAAPPVDSFPGRGALLELPGPAAIVPLKSADWRGGHGGVGGGSWGGLGSLARLEIYAEVPDENRFVRSNESGD